MLGAGRWGGKQGRHEKEGKGIQQVIGHTATVTQVPGCSSRNPPGPNHHTPMTRLRVPLPRDTQASRQAHSRQTTYNLLFKYFIFSFKPAM